MLGKDHPIKNIPRSKIEIWDEANVRRTNVEGNLEELADNIKHNGIEHPLLVKEVTVDTKYLQDNEDF